MVGKWHLGFCNWKYTPTFRGFDSYLGYYNAAEDYYTHVIGSGYDFRKDKDVDAADNGTYSAYVFTDRIIDIISTHNKSQPLFLYLPFQSVHAPLEVPVEYEEKYCSQTKDKDRRTKCAESIIVVIIIIIIIMVVVVLIVLLLLIIIMVVVVVIIMVVVVIIIMVVVVLIVVVLIVVVFINIGVVSLVVVIVAAVVVVIIIIIIIIAVAVVVVIAPHFSWSLLTDLLLTG
nr:hypothetical protein BaRGS_009919 [Batillaria attramentaria]